MSRPAQPRYDQAPERRGSSEVDAVTVGVVANPASGRDIRRLVTGASVFDNAEKGSMVHRLMAGLGASGVERVLMMPAGSGLSGSLARRLRSHAHDGGPMPQLEELPMSLTETATDSVEAVARMCDRGVAAIVVLGGDGTHRIVARECGTTPICGLSTGTNNAFPEMREATVAGIAVGLLATGRLPAGDVLRRAKVLRVEVGGRSDVALVDVAASRSRYVGARALWRIEDVTHVLTTFAQPHGIGLSAIAAQLLPTDRWSPEGVALELGDGPGTQHVLAAIAPGVVVDVPVRTAERLAPGVRVTLGTHGSIALDGEREIETGPEGGAEVWLDLDGPMVVDVTRALGVAARDGLMNGRRTAKGV
jgi:predicted polyphosphate/ATP-dependent NAD kinase